MIFLRPFRFLCVSDAGHVPIVIYPIEYRRIHNQVGDSLIERETDTELRLTCYFISSLLLLVWLFPLLLWLSSCRLSALSAGALECTSAEG